MQLQKHPGLILRIAIAIGYILLGIGGLFKPKLLNFLSTQMAYIFSMLLTGYGIFRLYRAYNLYKEID